MSLIPYSNRHAVQSAALVVGFHQEVDLGHASALAQAAQERLKAVLPNRKEIQTITFQFGAAVPQHNSSSIGGWEFIDNFSPNEVVNGVTTRRSASVVEHRLIITENSYNRWAHFSDFVSSVFEALSDIAFERRSVRDIALAYADSFTWKDAPEKIVAADVFSRESIFLPANVFGVGSKLFHATHGFFVDSGVEDAQSLIENVNVTRMRKDSAQYDTFAINTEHRLVVDRQMYGTEGRKFVEAQLEMLHQRNKAVLSNLLTQDVKEMIKLGG